MAEYVHAIIFWNPRKIFSYCAHLLAKIQCHQEIRRSSLILYLWSIPNHLPFGKIKRSALYSPRTSCCMLVLYAFVWQTYLYHSKSWRLKLCYFKLSSGQVKNLSVNYCVTEHTMKRNLLLTSLLIENGRSKLICNQKVQTSMVLQREVSVSSADRILAYINAQKVWILSKSINLQVSITVLDQNISSVEHFEGQSFFN